MDQREQIKQAIAALERQRTTLGDEVVETAVAALRDRLENARPQQIAQQRKQVTVLFADISGFTAMSESMDHEEVGALIDSLWTRVDGAILRHGGRIDKHIGDAVMALFGAPTAHEDDPERAIRAALDVQVELEAWKNEFVESGSPLQDRVQGLQLRIGINTGPALIGTIGSTGEYTAIGDTVNLASRMESSAPAGGILISRGTYRQVVGIFDLETLEPIRVKGKSEPVRVYRVTGIRPRALRGFTRGVQGMQALIVGRAAELARLREAFDQTVSGSRTQLVSVVAEAGSGKSRLLGEFVSGLDERGPLRLIRGRATSDMTMQPAALLREVLSFVYDIQESDRAVVARDKLERGVLAENAFGPDGVAAAHLIGQLIGFDFSSSPHVKGILADAQQARDMAFHYLAEIFAGWAQVQPVVLVLEDIHWADSTSLDLLDHLLKAKPDARLLVLCSTRSTLFEQRPEWAGSSEGRLRLDIPPLTDEEGAQLVHAILNKVSSVPASLVDMILEKAEGSPFYIEELINVLIEGGAIIPGPEEWRVEPDKLRTLRVPATLIGLLQARLDTLPPAHREVLQQAAVVGRVFWSNVVEQMRNPDAHQPPAETQIGSSLEALRLKDLIFHNEQSAFGAGAEFLFKNAVLHDVTYESVLLRLRRVYHVQVAEGLIRMGGERAVENAGRVGEHYEKAGELREAAEWYLRAGKRAQDTFAADTALAYFGKALEFLSDKQGGEARALQLEAYQRTGEVLIWQARYGEAVDNYNAMLGAATEAGDLVEQARALIGISSCLGLQGDQRQSMDYAVRAEQLARRTSANDLICKALWLQGSACYRLGEGHEALQHAEQALTISTNIDDHNEMARCLNLLGAAHYSLGRYEESEKCWEDALALFQDLGDRRKGMDLLNNLGVIADARGDYASAFQRYDGALNLARQMGYRDGEIVFLTNRGGEQVALGNYAEARADLTLALELAGTAGSWVLPNTYYYLAEASVRAGAVDEALKAACKALELGRQDGAPEYIGAAYRALAMVSDELGRPVHVQAAEKDHDEPCDAEQLFRESVRVLADGNMDGERARSLREWALRQLRRGDSQRGLQMWEEAREIFGRLGARLEFERMAEIPS